MRKFLMTIASAIVGALMLLATAGNAYAVPLCTGEPGEEPGLSPDATAPLAYNMLAGDIGSYQPIYLRNCSKGRDEDEKYCLAKILIYTPSPEQNALLEGLLRVGVAVAGVYLGGALVGDAADAMSRTAQRSGASNGLLGAYGGYNEAVERRISTFEECVGDYGHHVLKRF